MVTYMESRNILVKFEGSTWNESAILFTAHYDTSSLAPGATDDTIAVVSLLQIAEYLASNQPERSIIILFNDGEEDGLHGSRMYGTSPHGSPPI
jgi:Zn-dependent M28 family amino/carboxypeptidase